MSEIVLLVLTGWDEERKRNKRAVSQFALLVTLHRPSSLLRVVKVNEPRNSEILLRNLPLSLYHHRRRDLDLQWLQWWQKSKHLSNMRMPTGQIFLGTSLNKHFLIFYFAVIEYPLDTIHNPHSAQIVPTWVAIWTWGITVSFIIANKNRIYRNYKSNLSQIWFMIKSGCLHLIFLVLNSVGRRCLRDKDHALGQLMDLLGPGNVWWVVSQTTF